MSPVHSRLVGFCVALIALCGLFCWERSAASDSVEDVDLSLDLGGQAEFTNSLGMKLVRISAGKFMMGAPDGESGAEVVEKPRHEVLLTRDYYFGVHEVTQKQFERVTGKNPSVFCKSGGGASSVQGMDTGDFPVENVSWDDAQRFFEKLNALPAEMGAGRKYRLPTEAEWEYACRGGHKIPQIGEKAAALPFHFDKPSASMGFGQANFIATNPYGGGQRGQPLRRTCKVGSYRPNLAGVYDMHGNAREWCSDWYSPTAYNEKNRRDPAGPAQGTLRASRGGSWDGDGVYHRAAHRCGYRPGAGQNFVGFRAASTR